MRIKQSITINAPAQSVWDILTDYPNTPQWNNRVVEAKIMSSGPVGVGTYVRMTFKLSKEKVMDAKIDTFEAPRYLKVVGREHYITNPDAPQREYKEEYWLTEKNGQTHLRQEVVFDSSGTNPLLILLAKIIMTIGKSVGPGPLEGLKTFIEKTKP